MSEVDKPNPFKAKNDQPKEAESTWHTVAASQGAGNVYTTGSSAPVSQRDRGGNHVKFSVAALIIFIIVFIAASVGGYFLVDHIQRNSLANSCSDKLSAYQDVQKQLKKLLEDNDETLDVTIDQVTNKNTVSVLKDVAAQSQKIVDDTSFEGQCQSSRSRGDLAQTNEQLNASGLTGDTLVSRLQLAISDVVASKQAKDLADAKEALNTTIQSAAQLVNNLKSRGRTLNATYYDKLENALITASSAIKTSDTDKIKSARDELDGVIQDINDSISADTAEINEIEQKVRNIQNYADASGSYVSSALDIIHAAGLQESWGLTSMRGACLVTDEQAQSWLAAFCSATPGKVYIRNDLTADVTNDVYFADAMRHELGHYLINRRCGTTDPSVIGNDADTEAVTSAYAVLYLGANANTLNRAVDSRYHMTNSAYAAAAKIHAGQCY